MISEMYRHDEEIKLRNKKKLCKRKEASNTFAQSRKMVLKGLLKMGLLYLLRNMM